MAFEKLRTIVITATPKPRSRERFRKIAETTPTPCAAVCSCCPFLAKWLQAAFKSSRERQAWHRARVSG
jgi:hypothetical protein